MFKNAQLYRLRDPVPTVQQLIDAVYLGPQATTSKIGPHERFHLSWHPLTQVKNFFCASACLRTRQLPAKVVNQELAAQVATREANFNPPRKLSKKEIAQLKDELIFELLPKAFVVESRIDAILNTDTNLLIVNSASANKAELFISFLRESLAEAPTESYNENAPLSAIPVSPTAEMPNVFEEWLKHPDEMPISLRLGGDYKIETEDKDQKAQIKNFERDDTLAIMQNDMGDTGRIVEASLDYYPTPENEDEIPVLSFRLTDSLALKSIKVHDYPEELTPDDNPLAELFVVAQTLNNLVEVIINETGDTTRQTKQDHSGAWII